MDLEARQVSGGARGVRTSLGRRPRDVYDEKTFRYLWAVEGKRSERSGRPLLAVLVDRGQPSERIDPAFADKLFGRLSQCLRETDFVGWYEGGRVAGAVLTELGKERPPAELPGLVGRRICDQLGPGLPRRMGGPLRVRVLAHPEAETLGGFEAVLGSDRAPAGTIRTSFLAVRRALELAVGVAPVARTPSALVPTNGHVGPGMPEAISPALKSHPGQSGATRC